MVREGVIAILAFLVFPTVWAFLSVYSLGGVHVPCCESLLTDECDVPFVLPEVQVDSIVSETVTVSGHANVGEVSDTWYSKELYEEHTQKLSTCIKKLTTMIACYEDDTKSRTIFGILVDRVLTSVYITNKVVGDDINYYSKVVCDFLFYPIRQVLSWFIKNTA